MFKNTPSFVAAATLLALCANVAVGDIYQWEYINPADPGQGKRESTTLAPDGANVDAAPWAVLDGRNLTMAFLTAKDLDYSYAFAADLTNADLSQASLVDAHLGNAILVGANLTQANLNFGYLAGANLTGADFSHANLTDANLGQAKFIGANLTGANLTNSFLVGADLTGAQVRGTEFAYKPNPKGGIGYDPTITAAQLYSTASYQAHDLASVSFVGKGLNNWNFTGQNLTGANFETANLTGTDLTGSDLTSANLASATLSGAALTGANFTGARIKKADFSRSTTKGTGISPTQLAMTLDYQLRDLSQTTFALNKLSSANLAGQNLSRTSFSQATLTGASFANADLSSANLYGAKVDNADFTNANLAGASLYDANVTKANFSGAEIRNASFWFNDTFTASQLYSTASYQAHDLSGILMRGKYMLGWSFAGQNLTGADFYISVLTGADFSGAQIQGADFLGGPRDSQDPPNIAGLTLAQLYSTASYQAHDLTGVHLILNDLTGADLSGQKLASTDFGRAKLNGADLTNADLTSAGLSYTDMTAADTRGSQNMALVSNTVTANMIDPNGQIAGVDLLGGQHLAIRDYDGNPATGQGLIPIRVNNHFNMNATGSLDLQFESDVWDSTISFDRGIPVARGGMLNLLFASDANVADQIGRIFHVFDWTGVAPTGAFTVSSPYTWDLSKLYTSGEVTLTAVPESCSLALALAALAGANVFRRR